MNEFNSINSLLIHQLKDLNEKIAKQNKNLENAEFEISELKERLNLCLTEKEDNEKKMKADILQKGAIIGSYKSMVAKRDAKIEELEKKMRAARDVLAGEGFFVDGPAAKKFKTTK